MANLITTVWSRRDHDPATHTLHFLFMGERERERETRGLYIVGWVWWVKGKRERGEREHNMMCKCMCVWWKLISLCSLPVAVTFLSLSQVEFHQADCTGRMWEDGWSGNREWLDHTFGRMLKKKKKSKVCIVYIAIVWVIIIGDILQVAEHCKPQTDNSTSLLITIAACSV